MSTTKPYVQEDKDLIAKRVDAATIFIEQGLTYKHAWFKAFQLFPRVLETDEELLAKGVIS